MVLEHRVEEPQRPTWQIILLVVALVVGINAVVMFANRFPGSFGGLIGLVLIFVLAFYSSRLMSRKLARYTYRWDGRELAVERRLGRKNKPLLEIPGKQIDWVRPLEEVRPQLARMKRVRRTIAYACRTKGKDVYMLQFHEGTRRYRLIFQPSDPMVKSLVRQAKENGR